jgi:hypothetical protein
MISSRRHPFHAKPSTNDAEKRGPGRQTRRPGNPTHSATAIPTQARPAKAQARHRRPPRRLVITSCLRLISCSIRTRP